MMTFNSTTFKTAIDFISKLPGGTLPQANYVRFGDGKLRRSTFEAYCEMDLVGADEPIIMDAQLLRRIPLIADEISISTNNTVHKLVCGGFSSSIPKMTDPAIPDATPEGEGLKLDAPEGSFNFALAAASTEENRYVLNGVIFDGDGESLLVVGTSGQVLHVHDAGPTKLKRRLTLGTTHAKLMTEYSEIEVFKNAIVAENETSKIIAPIIEGEPPGIRPAMPDAFDGFVTLEKEVFLNAVKALAGMHAEPYIEASFSKDTLSLACKEKTRESLMTIACKCKDDWSGKIRSSYLLDSLPFCEDEITFSRMTGLPGLCTKINNRTIAICGIRTK